MLKGAAGFGGLCRDICGNWLVGFAGNAGIDSAIGSELKTIRFALQIAWERDWREIVIETQFIISYP